jgi:hypothetical protein
MILLALEGPFVDHALVDDGGRDDSVSIELQGPARLSRFGVERMQHAIGAAHVDDTIGDRWGAGRFGVERRPPVLLSRRRVEREEETIGAAGVDGIADDRHRGQGPRARRAPQLAAGRGVDRIERAVLAAGVHHTVDHGGR